MVLWVVCGRNRCGEPSQALRASSPVGRVKGLVGIGRQSIYLLAKDVKSSPLTLRELGGIQLLGSHIQNLMIRQGVGTKLILNIVLDITVFLCYSTTGGW